MTDLAMLEPTARPHWVTDFRETDTSLKCFRLGIDERVTDLHCPHAVDVVISGMEWLCRLDAPLTRRLDLDCCHELRELHVASARTVRLRSVWNLRHLVLPQARVIDVESCEALERIIAPKARIVRLRSLHDLREVIAPAMVDGECIDCGELLPESLDARLSYVRPGLWT